MQSRRYRAQLPRLSAQSGSALAFIIQYFEESPLDLKVVSQELIYNAYLVRSIKYLDNDHAQVRDSDELIQPEAWKNIWYFWGVIESICTAAGVDSMDVLERLKSQGKSSDRTPGSLEPKMRVSDLAELIQNGAGNSSKTGDESDDLDSEGNSARGEEQARRDNISSVFGN